MKSIVTSLLLAATLVVRAGQVNVAYNRPAPIVYTGKPPLNPAAADTRQLVDGNVNTLVIIDPSADNVGTHITISLGNIFPLTRYKINQPFGQQSSSL